MDKSRIRIDICIGAGFSAEGTTVSLNVLAASIMDWRVCLQTLWYLL